MLKKIVLATTNKGKIREMESILAGSPIEIVPLNRYPAMPEVLEDGRSFFENALKKARAVSAFTGEAGLADDSGLEVEALQGAPGIYSARYAGDEGSDEENIAKLLRDMAHIPPEGRGAAFRCVLVLYLPNGEYLPFEGRWTGRISSDQRGDSGFGYDPVFFLPDLGCTAAELPPDEKNRLSHRAQALQSLKAYLNQMGS